MDYIRKYDIELEKEQYYAGEVLRGWVVIENAENLRITGAFNPYVDLNTFFRFSATYSISM